MLFRANYLVCSVHLVWAIKHLSNVFRGKNVLLGMLLNIFEEILIHTQECSRKRRQKTPWRQGNTNSCLSMHRLQQL